MRRILCMALSIMLALGAAACTTAETGPAARSNLSPTAEPTAEPELTPSSEIIMFTDEVLEELVRVQMEKPQGDITIAEAEALECLDLSQPGGQPLPRIKDISTLKYFKNLKGLDLSYNEIEDLSPIAGLTKLEGLSYWGTERIKDFSALAGLTGMLDLTLGHKIHFNNTDIQNLTGMKNIEMLWIQGAKNLTDISVVADFKKLVRLNIDNSGVSDISPAAGLTTLIEVDLRGSKVSDISPLKDLVNLKKLFLEGCPVTDYSPLANIYPNLEEKDFEMK